MAKTKELSNNAHICAGTKYNMNAGKSSFEKLPYTDEELRKILDFYLFHAPVRKDSKEDGDGFELRYLGDYGWAASAELNRLEREMLKSSGITRFVLVKADTITEILDDMNLVGDMCVAHPRAVFNQLHKLTVTEYGEMKNSSGEKRLVCIFRHIRNSLAHNRVYLYDGDMIMLEDAADDGKNVTARLLMKSKTLIDWIYIVDKDNKYYYKPESEE